MMAPQVKHNPANTYHVLKVARLWLRIWKVQVAHPECSLMKMWKYCIEWSVRTDSVQLMMFVPFWANHPVHTEAEFVPCLLNDEQKQNWLSVYKDMEDKAFLCKVSCFQSWKSSQPLGHGFKRPIVSLDSLNVSYLIWSFNFATK